MNEEKISSRQTGVLSVMLILANSILVTPSVLFKEIGADGFWVVLLLTGIDLLVLGVFFMLKAKFPTQKFYDILRQYLGKVIAKIILLCFLVIFLFKSLFTFSVVYMYLKQQVYQEAFEWLAIICIIPIVNHAALVGIRPLARTIELFFYAVLAGVLLCLAMSFSNNFGIPLFFQTNAPKFALSIFKHIFSFGDYLLLFLIMDKIDLQPKSGRKILNFAILGVALVLAVYFRFYSMFRITAFMHNNALVDISMLSPEYASLGKLDVIPLVTVLFLTFFQMELYVYGFCSSFVDIFPRLNKTHAVIAYDILFFLLQIMLLQQYDFFIGATESYLPVLVLVVNFLLPIVLTAIVAKSKRRFQKLF